jgi:molybdate transport system regulatory protein
MKKIGIQGDISFQRAGHDPLGEKIISLLESIRDQGSIVQAAKTVGVSYKTAWDMLNRANNLADQPLATRIAGGAGGGSTSLTPTGEKFVRQYRIIQEEQSKYLAALAKRIEDPEAIISYLRRIAMRLSARNVLAGKIVDVKKGAVNAEVILAVSDHDQVAAIITNESVTGLGLKIGGAAYAILKASSIIVGVEAEASKLSARNVLLGKVSKVVTGAVNDEVDIALPGGRTLSAIITKVSAEKLGLKEGMQVAAIFKASAVIIGVD